jgi:hypothetical protein
VTDEGRRAHDRRGWWLSIITFLGGFLTDVIANNVHVPVGIWLRGLELYQHWALVVAAAGFAGLVVYTVRRAWPERALSAKRGEAGLGTSFPPAPVLVGRDDEIREATQAARHGLVVAHGPSGMGSSAVAIAAAWNLSPEPSKQRYIDLRGQDPSRPESAGRTAIRVLRALGIHLGRSHDVKKAAKRLAETLQRTQVVVLLDNAENIEQISWVAHQIPGAHLVIAGHFPELELPERDRPKRRFPDGVAHVRVGPLTPQAALRLLSRQGGESTGAGLTAPGASPASRARRRVSWPRAGLRRLMRYRRAPNATQRRIGPRGLMRRRRALNTIQRRIGADPVSSQNLAAYLTCPRVAILMGKWLAANPQVTLRAVWEDIQQSGGRSEENGELRYILQRLLDGASRGALDLMALLARAPASELSQAAVAAIAGIGLERTGDLLAELAGRSLVVWTRPSRCRISQGARLLAERVSPADLAESQVRLARYFSELATAYAEALGPGHGREEVNAAAEWLQIEDATLLQLLRISDPAGKAAPSLWQIASALDTWFAAEGRLDDRKTAAKALAAAAHSLSDPTAEAVAHLRLAAIERMRGDFTTAARRLDDADHLFGPAGACQLDTARTVYYLTIGDLDAAQEHLVRSRQSRPRSDLVGQATDLINQAVLQIETDAVDAAGDTLNLVLDLIEDDLAERSPNIGIQAHAHELLGIVAWKRGQRQRAMDKWMQAETMHVLARDADGEARCLHHRGSALVTTPALQAETNGHETTSARHEPAEDPAELFLRSLELRGGQQSGPDIELTQLYLLDIALTHLYLGELAARSHNVEELAHHRQAGLHALTPWEDQDTEPAKVTEVRNLLRGLGNPPAESPPSLR